MNKTRFSFSVLATFLFLIACATAGQAAPRTFVSGSGSDANAPGCTFSLPCRFLNTAYANTDIGGEIIALSPAGYGGLAITHAITVQAVPGTFGFISVVAGSAGIAVTAGALESVIIRNFQFSASPALAANSIGVQHNSGKLTIENCFFSGLATGIQVNNAKADVLNSDMTGNTVGISTTGRGYDPGCQSPGFSGQWPGDAVTQVRIDRGNLNSNGTGFQMNNPGSRHVNCFCSDPSCVTPTPSLNPNLNLITIFLHSTDAGGSGITLNITGNTTYMAGTGATCTATPGLCANAQIYNGEINPK